MRSEMKKILALALVSVCLFVGVLSLVAESENTFTVLDNPFSMYLNGEDTRTESFLFEDRIYIPLRWFLEEMDHFVHFDEEEKIVNITGQAVTEEEVTTEEVTTEEVTTEEVTTEEVTTEPAPTLEDMLCYTDVIEVKSYAYTDDGTKTRLGTPCKVGVIAVDPTVIPLGSMVYVEDYGLALAMDTGGAIKGNTIDVYLDTEEECRKHGVRKNVKVYILEAPYVNLGFEELLWAKGE